MTNSETKRCHFVPITYLEKFYQNVNNKNTLVARPKLGGKTFTPKPTSICVRKHLYIMPGETEDERQIIEKFYSNNIENNYNRVYDILTKSKIKRITNTDRELVLSTIITFLFRNPFILDRFNEFWSESIDRLFNLAETTTSRSFQIDDKTINIDDTTKTEFVKSNNEQNKHIFNITHIRLAFRLMEIRANDGISVTEIEDDHEYISSDNPVTISNQNSRIGSIFDPTNFLRLPLNKKKCLVIYPFGTKDFDPKEIYRRKVKSTSALLDTIYVNKLQQFYANQILIGSIKSFRTLNELVNKTDDEVLNHAIEIQKDMQSEFNDAIRKKFK
jgi:Protein of unknown function (DUF4238)